MTLRFALRLLALLAVAAGGTGILLQPMWGNGAFWLLGWSTAWGLLLGILGYRSMRTGIVAKDATEMSRIILGGLFLRVLVIVVSHTLLYWELGSDWGMRALITTVAFYVLALGCEVFTVNQELKSGMLVTSSGSRPPSSESTG